LLGDRESALVTALIREFYSNSSGIGARATEHREFGFGDFERKIRYRHYSFTNEKALKDYLVRNAPPFVSASAAEYQKPDARPMENKKWIGEELLFDIDASDLKLKCRSEHDGSWVCHKCLNGAKEETVKLIEDFLIPDFGMSEEEISVNFSGNRGYHIHVHNKDMFKLDGDARKGIVNYITGNGIELTSFFPTMGRRGVRLEGPKPTDYGWGGKLANGVIKALGNGTSGLMELGIDKKSAELLVRKSAEIRLGISTGNWDKINIPRKAEFWGNVLKGIAITQSDAIDKNVSTDIYHLIRLPGTIHGDTGLVSKTLKSVKSLGDFNPMNEAIAFDDKKTKVKTAVVPKFNMCHTDFGPYSNQLVELPRYVAVYLILKRFAILAV